MLKTTTRTDWTVRNTADFQNFQPHKYRLSDRSFLSDATFSHPPSSASQCSAQGPMGFPAKWMWGQERRWVIGLDWPWLPALQRQEAWVSRGDPLCSCGLPLDTAAPAHSVIHEVRVRESGDELTASKSQPGKLQWMAETQKGWPLAAATMWKKNTLLKYKFRKWYWRNWETSPLIPPLMYAILELLSTAQKHRKWSGCQSDTTLGLGFPYIFLPSSPPSCHPRHKRRSSHSPCR